VSNIQTKTTLTVGQFGTVREPNPDKIQIVAGERLDGNDYIMVPYLWFREWGSRRCLRLNATNIAFLTERGYTDVQALIGCTITLEVVEKVNYGKRQPMVLITSINRRKAKRTRRRTAPNASPNSKPCASSSPNCCTRTGKPSNPLPRPSFPK